MPLNEECHEKRLRDRGIYTEQQVVYTLNRADMYKSYNQNHPGFFDMMINSGEFIYVDLSSFLHDIYLYKEFIYTNATLIFTNRNFKINFA